MRSGPTISRTPFAAGHRASARVIRLAILAAFCALALVGWGSETSSARENDLGVYARAVEYCRGEVKRPMALDLDNRVLCFDGVLSAGGDVSLARRLEQNGLFVVRSTGGDIAATIALANLVRDRHATVVVYDYCLLACASFLFFASENTFVLKDSIVAWDYSNDPSWFPSLETAKDGGPKRLEIAPCSDAPPENKDAYSRFKTLSYKFYHEARTVDPRAEWPPQSFFIRQSLRDRFEGTGRFPDAFWTWNPKYYARAIKTKVVYEAYPQSESELDAIATRLGLPHVLYDP